MMTLSELSEARSLATKFAARGLIGFRPNGPESPKPENPPTKKEPDEMQFLRDRIKLLEEELSASRSGRRAVIFGPSRRALIDGIVGICARAYGVEPKALSQPGKMKHNSYARMSAMAMLRKFTTLSFSEVAEEFNRKDHTTPVYACRAFKRLSGDREYKRTCEHIEAECNALVEDIRQKTDDVNRNLVESSCKAA